MQLRVFFTQQQAKKNKIKLWKFAAENETFEIKKGEKIEFKHLLLSLRRH